MKNLEKTYTLKRTDSDTTGKEDTPNEGNLSYSYRLIFESSSRIFSTRRKLEQAHVRAKTLNRVDFF